MIYDIEYYDMQKDLANFATRILGPIANKYKDPSWHKASQDATEAFIHFAEDRSILGAGCMLRLRTKLMHLPGYNTDPILDLRKIVELSNELFIQKQIGDNRHEPLLTYTTTKNAIIELLNRLADRYRPTI